MESGSGQIFKGRRGTKERSNLNDLVIGAAAAWTVLFVANLALAANAPRLPSPLSEDLVQKISIDGDGERLVLFYCAYDVSLGQNPGVVIEWNGSSWGYA